MLFPLKIQTSPGLYPASVKMENLRTFPTWWKLEGSDYSFELQERTNGYCHHSPTKLNRRRNSFWNGADERLFVGLPFEQSTCFNLLSGMSSYALYCRTVTIHPTARTVSHLRAHRRIWFSHLSGVVLPSQYARRSITIRNCSPSTCPREIIHCRRSLLRDGYAGAYGRTPLSWRHRYWAFPIRRRGCPFQRCSQPNS